ncbi:MAG: hypothetical protein SNG49_07610 [Rikenellaceae bacterium]
MKKFYLSLVVACACLMVACGNAEIDKIQELVVEATEQTKAAKSAEEVGEIANELQEAMDQIAAESGDKLTFGKDVDEALTEYQKVSAAKLKEFGIEVEF